AAVGIGSLRLLVGLSVLGCLPSDLAPFLGRPLPGLLFRLVAQGLVGSGLMAFALQGLGDGLRPSRVGFVRMATLPVSTGRFRSPPGFRRRLTLFRSRHFHPPPPALPNPPGHPPLSSP